MKHVISALVENKSGVLARISGLFSGRGFNIDSLAVGETEDPGLSRMTIAVAGDERILEQVMKQLRKVIDVVKVQDFSGQAFVERDLALIKVNAPTAKRNEITQIASVFRARVVDISRNEMILEVSGPENKIEAMVDLLEPYGIKEMARTGRIALLRGTQPKGNHQPAK